MANTTLLIINLNEHCIECRICGELTLPKYGVPMYENMVLPNDWSEEWFGQPACRSCFEIQNKLTKPMDEDKFRTRSKKYQDQ